MATTTQSFTGTGSQTQFTIAFPYRTAADVKATIDAALTTAFSISGSTVTFNTAPANGAAVIIYRRTSNDTIEADFQSGSALRAVDLNNNFEQVLFVTQESSDLSDTATTNASTAVTNAANAVTTSNTANTNSTNAVATANTASTNATNAVNTANTASTNATAALNNSRESDGSGGFTSAITKANTAITTANSASSTATTASTNASSAVTTANTASTNATNAVSTANTASTNASTALSTANSATTTANTALTNSRESDGSGGFTTAISKANTAVSTANTASSNASTALSTANTASTNASNAVTTANAASTAVSAAAFYSPIANVAAIPGSPSNEDRIEILNSTGIQSFSPLAGLPSGFTGSSDLTVRLQYNSSGSTWDFKQYFAEDPEARYATTASVTTNTTNIATNVTNIGTKMPLAGGTFSGAVNFDDNVIIKGDSTNGSGKLTLNCENNSHGVHIKGPPHSAGATYTLTLPNNTGTNGQALLTNGSGVMSWGTVTTDLSGVLALTGGTMTGALTLSGAPTASLHAASKQYVDDNAVLVADGGNFNTGGSIVSSSSTFDGGSFD